MISYPLFIILLFPKYNAFPFPRTHLQLGQYGSELKQTTLVFSFSLTLMVGTEFLEMREPAWSRTKKSGGGGHSKINE